MNWGWKIIILYGAFVAGMLFLVYKTSKVNVDLVTEKYYERELAFQDHLDAVERTQKSNSKLTWEVKQDEIVFRFSDTSNSIIGSEFNVNFYCASNAKNDKNYSMKLDQGRFFSIPTNQLKNGKYDMQMSWKVGEDEYYQSDIINI